jgi:hypothetical protein
MRTALWIVVFVATAFVIFVAGTLFGKSSDGEWKAVGDGKHVIHSQTGEIRKIDAWITDKKSVVNVFENQPRWWRQALLSTNFFTFLVVVGLALLAYSIRKAEGRELARADAARLEALALSRKCKE